MTYLNGRIPTTRLTPVAYAPHHRATAGAARAMTALSARFRRQFEENIHITDSYRTYAQQVAVKRVKGFLAATPGRSNHGWGLAFDLASGIEDRSTNEHQWMQRNAKHFGFENPAWATPGTKAFQKNEPWHWEYVNPAGDGSRAVLELQRKLQVARLLTDAPDAYWWTNTEAAWRVLMEQMRSGTAARGRVEWFQRILARPYAGSLYTLEIDGIPGKGTLAAATAFHTRFSGIK